MRAYLEQIVRHEETTWKFESIDQAKKFTYLLRNALNYSYKNGIEPYCKVFGKVKHVDREVSFSKDEKWKQVFDDDDLITPDASNFTELVLWVMNNPVADNICVTAVQISVGEEEMFSTWREVNNFELLENTILRKTGGLVKEANRDLFGR